MDLRKNSLLEDELLSDAKATEEGTDEFTLPEDNDILDPAADPAPEAKKVNLSQPIGDTPDVADLKDAGDESNGKIKAKQVKVKTKVVENRLPYFVAAALAVLVIGIYIIWPISPEKKYKQAVAHFEAEKYTSAVPLFLEVADAGFPKTNWYLGYCYENGYGVEKDLKQAYNHYASGAIIGDTIACYDVARCLEYGIGTAIDEDLAIEWYQKSGTDKAKQRLAKLNCNFGLTLHDDKVVLTAEKCPDCRIVSVTLDYFNEESHYVYHHPVSNPKKMTLYPKANCTVIYSYQHKNRAVKKDSIAFNFHGMLEWAIQNRDRNFIQQVMPYDREINIWLSESEGYQEYPTLDILNKYLDTGYKIKNFSFDKSYSSSLDGILNSTHNRYSRISELFLEKE